MLSLHIESTNSIVIACDPPASLKEFDFVNDATVFDLWQ